MKTFNWWDILPCTTESEKAAFDRRAIAHHKEHAEKLAATNETSAHDHAYLGLSFDLTMRGEWELEYDYQGIYTA